MLEPTSYEPMLKALTSDDMPEGIQDRVLVKDAMAIWNAAIKYCEEKEVKDEET